MNTSSHRLELLKTFLAIICFILNAIAIIGIAVLLNINFIVMLIYSFLLLFPLLGYILLWGYLKESQRTNENSSTFWLMSFCYNLAGVLFASAVVFDLITGYEKPVFAWMFGWTLCMSFISVCAAWLSNIILRSRQGLEVNI